MPHFAVIRIATLADRTDLFRVRMSVTENRLSDPSVIDDRDVDRMLTGDGRSWVGVVDGRVVAFAMADLANANIYALFVEPEYEGQGIGRHLHDTMLDWMFGEGLPEVSLSTDPNTRAEAFYRKAGWVATGMKVNGEIEFTMARQRWISAEGSAAHR